MKRRKGENVKMEEKDELVFFVNFVLILFLKHYLRISL